MAEVGLVRFAQVALVTVPRYRTFLANTYHANVLHLRY
jgi:hypothetical protein